MRCLPWYWVAETISKGDINMHSMRRNRNSPLTVLEGGVDKEVEQAVNSAWDAQRRLLTNIDLEIEEARKGLAGPFDGDKAEVAALQRLMGLLNARMWLTRK